ncbi:MAG: hypothetical protein AAGA85_19500 [Bacteroidota bacterium]
MDSSTSFEKQSRRNKTNKFLGYGFLWLAAIGFIEVIPYALGESKAFYHWLSLGMLLASAWNFRTGILLRRDPRNH